MNQQATKQQSKEVKDLAEMAVKIEKHYGRPMERHCHFSGGWWLVAGCCAGVGSSFFFVEPLKNAGWKMSFLSGHGLFSGAKC